MKTIVVKWVPDTGMYGMEMRVIESDHDRFVKGYRFDYGFFSIATKEGYTIVSIPMDAWQKPTSSNKELPKGARV